MADVNLDPVLELQQTITKKENGVDVETHYTAPIGAVAKNIQIQHKDLNTNNLINHCSLQDFFDNWEDFKENGEFMYYGTTEPTSQNIKFWYDTSQ